MICQFNSADQTCRPRSIPQFCSWHLVPSWGMNSAFDSRLAAAGTWRGAGMLLAMYQARCWVCCTQGWIKVAARVCGSRGGAESPYVLCIRWLWACWWVKKCKPRTCKEGCRGWGVLSGLNVVLGRPGKVRSHVPQMNETSLAASVSFSARSFLTELHKMVF